MHIAENEKLKQDAIDRLFQIDAKHHWMLAHSDLIQALYHAGKHPSYGLRGKFFRGMFGWLRFTSLALFALRVVGAVEAFKWWWKAGSANGLPENPLRLFVGFGAGPEDQMWNEFLAEDKIPAIRLDQTIAATFGALHRPALMRLLATEWEKAGTAYHFVANSVHEWVVANRLDFLTFACMRCGQYAFFFEWWRDLRSKQLTKVVFISNDTPAFACLDAGFQNSEFRQHGCLRRSNLMPRFPVLQILTKEEADYLKRVLPGSMFRVARPEVQISKHNRLLLIASVYDFEGFNKAANLQKLEEVFSWAGSQGLAINVRLHPREDPSFWRSNFPSAAIDVSDASFEDALSRLRPIIVLSWFSTALIDALLRGVVPVSISSADNLNLQDMIISLHRHCLRWPAQRTVLDDLATGRARITDIVHSLIGAGDNAR